MPGIVGLCDFQRDNEELTKLLDAMSRLLCHESWYHADRYVNAPLAMGRVSLGLPSAESQPMFDQDRTCCIVLDGELYGYGPLKAQLRAEGHRFSTKSDAEFLLHWYEARGIDGLGELNGSFVLAIWDSRTRTVTLANDRYGLRPLYYAQKAGCLLFASEVKAILADPLLTREIDHHAVADFFSFELLMGDKTFFSEVRALPAASTLTFGLQSWSMRRYWDFAFCEEPTPVDERAVVARLDELLQSAARRCTSKELATGVFLSGGLDSRTLLGAIARQSLPVQTFTMGREDSFDVRFAQQIADRVGMEHHSLTLRPEAQAELIERGVWLTDGMKNCIHMSILNLLPLARDHVSVVLDGIGGGVALGGAYLRPSSFGVANDDELTRILFTRFNTAFSPNLMRDFLADDFFSRIKDLAYESMREQVQQASPARSVSKSEYVYLRNRQRHFNAFGPIMTRSQLESRAPFYDNDLVDFVYSLPAEVRLDHKLHWRLLTERYPELAGVPWTFTGLPVGASIPAVRLISRAWFRVQRETNKVLLRVSKGHVSLSNPRVFTDYASWWRTVLRDWALDLILSPRALERGYVNPDAVRSLVAQHVNGCRDHTVRLGILVTFELWNRMFVDRAGLEPT